MKVVELGLVVAKDVENLTLNMLREIRREQTEHRQLLLGLVDQVRRLETRVDHRLLGIEQRSASVREDLEFMMRSEIMGRLPHFETMFEQRLDDLRDTSRPSRT